jgi:hypothetical protein
MSDAKFDSKRRLCPDGSCIGVVGDDGRCKVCGRDTGGAKSAAAAGGLAVSAAAVTSVDSDVGDDDSDGDTDSETEMAADAAEPGALSFDPSRRLCSDGNCIGLIGTDGNCNVCGKPASE